MQPLIVEWIDVCCALFPSNSYNFDDPHEVHLLFYEKLAIFQLLRWAMGIEPATEATNGKKSRILCFDYFVRLSAF